MRSHLVDQFRTFCLMTLFTSYAIALRLKANDSTPTSSLKGWTYWLIGGLLVVGLFILWLRSRHHPHRPGWQWLMVGVFAVLLVLLVYWLERHRGPVLILVVIGAFCLVLTLIWCGLLLTCMARKEFVTDMDEFVEWGAYMSAPLAAGAFVIDTVLTWNEIQKSADGWWIIGVLYLMLLMSVVNTLGGYWALEDYRKPRQRLDRTIYL